MAIYRVVNKKTGKVYEYEYPRQRFNNNSPEYNREYYRAHKQELMLKSKKRRREKRIDERLKQVAQENDINV